MKIEFLDKKIWPELMRAAKTAKQPCSVAVAYFGKGASELLPLPAASRLVVDASRTAIASGQTCPHDLLKMVNRGVSVFTVPNLHAKIFVLGRAVFIGSANVSKRSAGTLIEAMVRIADPTIIRSARAFVDRYCLHQLTPAVLKNLKKLYRPPIIPGGVKRNISQNAAVPRPTLPRLLLVQLRPEELREAEQKEHDAGMVVARKRREHPRNYLLDSFWWRGECPCQERDVVIQITEESNGRFLVTVPANILYVRKRQKGKRKKTFVYIEHPNRRRRELKVVSKALGSGSLKKLRANGVVRDAAFAQALFNYWSN